MTVYNSRMNERAMPKRGGWRRDTLFCIWFTYLEKARYADLKYILRIDWGQYPRMIFSLFLLEHTKPVINATRRPSHFSFGRLHICSLLPALHTF